MAISNVKGRWAIVLGASSGFGEAISLRLAEEGMNIVGVHLDRKSTQPHAEEVVQKVRACGSKAIFFNVNAADAERRGEILSEVEKQSEGGVHCLVHSLAFGTLRPFIGEDKDRISKEQVEQDTLG